MDKDLNDRGTKNRVKGAAEQVEGRVRNAVGGLAGDTKEQIKGKGEELKGKMRGSVGKTQQDAARDEE